MLFIIFLYSIFYKTINSSTTSPTSIIYGQQRCMKPVLIQIPECQNAFYNYTGMPNLVNQETQFDARHQLQTFRPLITYKCSSKLNFFLCSVYTPMCDVNTHYLIGPCRPLCEHVRARCAPVLKVFDFNWPENLNCSRFPIKNSVDGAMCMEGPEDMEDDVNSSKHGSNTNVELKNKIVQKPDYNDLPLDPSVKQMLQAISLDNGKDHNKNSNNKEGRFREEEQQEGLKQIMEKLTGDDLLAATTGHFFPNTLTSHLNKYPLSVPQLAKSIRYCSHLKKPTFYAYVNRTGRCAPLCEADILYSTEAKTLSTMWTSILAGVCSLMTTFTLIRYVMNPSEFRPNEKPIVYIALCQLLFALGYGLSISLGRTNVTCGRDLDSGRRIRLQEGLDNALCAFIFMIQYFFSTASTIWWAMLVIHWALQRISMIMSCISCSCYNIHPTLTQHTSINTTVKRKVSSSDTKHDIDTINTKSSYCCCCFKINSFCFCSENSFNWNQSEIIMNERLIQSTIQHTTNNLNNPTSTNIQQVTHNFQYSPFNQTTDTTSSTVKQCDNKKRDTSWPTSNYHHLHQQQQQQFNPRHTVFTTLTKSDQVSACLAREHVVAWLTAGLFTVGILVSRQVDADELIPVCGVGRQNTNVLGAFILAPQTVLIILGSIAFIIGFICLLPCLRNCKCFYWLQHNMNGNQLSQQQQQCVIQQKQQNYTHGIDCQPLGNSSIKTTFTKSVLNELHHQKHNHQSIKLNSYSYFPHQHAYNHSTHLAQLHNRSSSCQHFHHNSISSCDPMEFRIGLFCFLYLIPLICMNACDFYEYLYRDKWLTIPGYHKHTQDQYSNNLENIDFTSYLWNLNEVYGPNPELFMLRIFMSLVTGFTCSLWMWTVKGCYCHGYNSINYDCCLCFINYIETLKQRKEQQHGNQNQLIKVMKLNNLSSNELNKSNYMQKLKSTHTPEGTTYSLHPYAIYQHTKTLDEYNSSQQLDTRYPIIGCSSTSRNTTATNIVDRIPTSLPSLLTKDHLSQLDTNFVIRDFEHSNATTPGYYSHAKISPNMIIDSVSEDASASSIPPPPLPPSSSRPPRLPARGDPCVGASASQEFGLTNQMNTDNHKVMNNDNNNNDTKNYSLIKFQTVN
ncbi:hypothetical protein MN116_007721 [Schistosoma mekongi]|uniref:FZ domain-containing protein n=1 Tax=Schistosoma mekongi TaxID=38744 RepID=A0AAE1Z7F7_SCHME|nr:hypothetical protein MN116_007721 [Schistosoma mekongi]